MRAQTAHGRSIRTLLAVALATVLLPLAQLATTTPVAAAAAPSTAAAAPSGPGSITLHVQSARSVNAGARLRPQGRRRPEVQVDHQRRRHRGPRHRRPTGHRQVPAGHGPGGSSDPDYADTCLWPSTRNTSGFAPIVAQGDETDLNDSTALDNLPAGKYLISVTADGFKIDGAHFTVAGGHPAGDGGDEPDAAAADDDPPPGLQRQRARGRDLRGRRRAGALRLHRAPHRRLRHGQRRLLRQRAVHGLPAPEPERHRRRSSSTPNNQPIVDTTRSTGRCVSDGTGQIVIPNLGPNRYAATVTPPAGRRPDVPVGADDHPRGRPRPRHLGAGGRHRLRHRADQGRRARSRRAVRLRPDPGHHRPQPEPADR